MAKSERPVAVGAALSPDASRRDNRMRGLQLLACRQRRSDIAHDQPVEACGVRRCRSV